MVSTSGVVSSDLSLQVWFGDAKALSEEPIFALVPGSAAREISISDGIADEELITVPRKVRDECLRISFMPSRRGERKKVREDKRKEKREGVEEKRNDRNIKEKQRFKSMKKCSKRGPKR